MRADAALDELGLRLDLLNRVLVAHVAQVRSLLHDAVEVGRPRAHAPHVRRMAARMLRLAPKLLSRAAVLAYVRELLRQYAALQTAPVRRHPDARPLVAFSWDV